MRQKLTQALAEIREKKLEPNELLAELQRLKREEVPKISRPRLPFIMLILGFSAVLFFVRNIRFGLLPDWLMPSTLNIGLVLCVLVALLFLVLVLIPLRTSENQRLADLIERMIPVVEQQTAQRSTRPPAPRETQQGDNEGSQLLVASLPNATETYSNIALITVHGVNSHNEGFASLSAELCRRLPGLRVYFVKYDEKIIRKISAEKRAIAYWEVYNSLMAATRYLDQNDRVFLLAHSFGTIATVQALQGVIEGLRLDAIIWLGCALPRFQNWNWLHRLYGKGDLVQQLHIIRPFDWVVLFARFVGGGDAGSKGFVSMGWRAQLPTETVKSGGHSGYVDDADEIQAILTGQQIPLTTMLDWTKRQRMIKRLFLYVKSLV